MNEPLTMEAIEAAAAELKRLAQEAPRLWVSRGQMERLRAIRDDAGAATLPNQLAQRCGVFDLSDPRVRFQPREGDLLFTGSGFYELGPGWEAILPRY